MRGKKSVSATAPDGSFQFYLQKYYDALSTDAKYILNAYGFSEYFTVDQFLDFLIKATERLNESTDDDYYTILRFTAALYFDIHLKESDKRKFARSLVHSLSASIKSVKLFLFVERSLISNDFDVQQSVLKSLMMLFNATELNTDNIRLYIDEIVPYLEYVLENCETKLNETDNRSVIAVVLNTAHLCIQIALAIIQKYRIYCSERLHISTLYQHVSYIQQHPKVTLDTNFNCALLLMLLNYLQDGLTSCIRFYENENIAEKQSPVTVLAVSHAFLTVISVTDITEEQIQQTLVRKLLTNIFEFYERYPNDNHIVLGLCKVMRSISRCICSDSYLIPDSMLSKFVVCVWLYLDKFTDVVKYFAKDIMCILISNKDSRVLNEIFKLIKGAARMDYCKSVALCCLSNRIPISELIPVNEPFVENMISMLEEGSNFIYIKDLYETLMKKHHEQTNPEVWFDVWIYPIIERLQRHDVSRVLEEIVIFAVKMEPFIITHLIETLLDAEDSKYKIVIKCLAVLRKHTNNISLLLKEWKSNYKSELWKDFLPLDVIKRGILNGDPEISIITAGLIVFSCKSTEYYTATEIELLKIFISLNISNKAESVRQCFLNVVKNMVIRLNENITTMNRKRQNTSNNNNEENLDELLEVYANFTAWIIEYCTQNLFSGSCFARKYTVLSVISILHDMKLMQYTRKMLDMLLYCLTDSYEVNKKLAIKLLTDIPSSECDLEDDKRLFSLFQTAVTLCLSIRSPHNSSGAYILQLLCWYKCSPFDLQPVCSEDSIFYKYITESTQTNDATLGTLDVLIRLLKDRLNNSDNCLFKKPVYGILHTMRHLIKTVSVQHISTNEKWKPFVEDLIPTCLLCNELALKIVGSPHPEGYTLDDDSDDDIDEYDYDDDGDNDADANNHGRAYAQFTLVCSWRTIKEASLMLGDLSQICFNLHRNNVIDRIDKTFMLLIGEKLRCLLVSVIHRGAFEQIYIAFSQLCYYLWRFPDDQIRNSPEKWLFDILSKIRYHDDYFCSARRSAGLPFIIQALLCTEKSTKKSCSSYLGNVMKSLFDICTSSDCSEQARVHALNILKTLFKNAQLGEEVLIYVETAIIIAMDGIKSSYWPERNSSTLLLSSVITRVFGVSRCRNKIAWKNKMTSELFFRNYPSLFDLFINHLKTGLDSPSLLQSSLYTSLLLLSRLYPSSCENANNSESRPNSFIPYIYRCSGSPIFKIRELTSVAISSFITPGIFVEHIEMIMRHLQMNLNENAIHGLLLQLEYMLQNIPSLSGKQSRLRNVMVAILKGLIPFLSSIEHSYVVKETFVKCALQILKVSDRFDLIDINDTLCSDRLLILLSSSGLYTDSSRDDDFTRIGRRTYEDALTILIFYIDLRRASSTMGGGQLSTGLSGVIEKNIFDNESAFTAIAIDVLFYIKLGEESFVNSNVISTFADRSEAKKMAASKLTRNIIIPTSDYLNSVRRKNVNDYLFILKYLLISDDDNYHHVSTVLDIFEECRMEDVISLVILYLDNYVELERGIDDMRPDLIRILNRALHASLFRYASDKILPFILRHFNKFTVACIDSTLLALRLWTYVVKQSLSHNSRCSYLFSEKQQTICSLVAGIVQRFAKSEHIDLLSRVIALTSWTLINVGKLYNTSVKQRVFVSEGSLLEDELILSRLSKRELESLLSDHPSLLSVQLENEVISWFEETCSIRLSSDEQPYTLLDIINNVKTRNIADGDYFSFITMNFDVAKVVAIEKLKLISDIL